MEYMNKNIKVESLSLYHSHDHANDNSYPNIYPHIPIGVINHRDDDLIFLWYWLST